MLCLATSSSSCFGEEKKILHHQLGSSSFSSLSLPPLLYARNTARAALKKKALSETRFAFLKVCGLITCTCLINEARIDSLN